MELNRENLNLKELSDFVLEKQNINLNLWEVNIKAHKAQDMIEESNNNKFIKLTSELELLNKNISVMEEEINKLQPILRILTDLQKNHIERFNQIKKWFITIEKRLIKLEDGDSENEN